MRTWRCRHCRRTVQLSYEDLADIGVPVCGDSECPGSSGDMELVPEVPGDRAAVSPPRPRARMVIEMFGGTVDGVYIDSPEVEITDVLFVEDPKYAAEDESPRLVKAGWLKGKFVQAAFGPPTLKDALSVTYVMEATDDGSHVPKDQ